MKPRTPRIKVPTRKRSEGKSPESDPKGNKAQAGPHIPPITTPATNRFLLPMQEGPTPTTSQQKIWDVKGSQIESGYSLSITIAIL
ncbi:hypothetical protein SUGI_0267830 [Cryptomeria japonica]|nr:hypothetical protein SUGI_0267830 [Cryptomeria japonica]